MCGAAGAAASTGSWLGRAGCDASVGSDSDDGALRPRGHVGPGQQQQQSQAVSRLFAVSGSADSSGPLAGGAAAGALDGCDIFTGAPLDCLGPGLADYSWLPSSQEDGRLRQAGGCASPSADRVPETPLGTQPPRGAGLWGAGALPPPQQLWPDADVAAGVEDQVEGDATLQDPRVHHATQPPAGAAGGGGVASVEHMQQFGAIAAAAVGQAVHRRAAAHDRLRVASLCGVHPATAAVAAVAGPAQAPAPLAPSNRQLPRCEAARPDPASLKRPAPDSARPGLLLSSNPFGQFGML
jgi:hypothetical protein